MRRSDTFASRGHKSRAALAYATHAFNLAIPLAYVLMFATPLIGMMIAVQPAV